MCGSRPEAIALRMATDITSVPKVPPAILVGAPVGRSKSPNVAKRVADLSRCERLSGENICLLS